VILDSNLKINLSSRVVKTSHKAKTIIFANAEHQNDTKIKNKVELLKEKNINVMFVPSSRNSSKNSSAVETYTKLDISEVLKTMYNQFGITSTMLEAGPTLLTSFLVKKLIDKFYIFLAPRIVGESSYPMFSDLHIDRIEDALKIDFKTVRRIGEDILLIAYPKYNNDIRIH
ncbi:MAG: RibD family protein, partial [Actinobacteria bacterium]|nr:RibD family protein [Actinomycetota bacterium]